MNWAADLKAPKNEYLLFDDHPDIIIPYTDNEDIENKNITPSEASETTAPYVKGNTDQSINLIQK